MFKTYKASAGSGKTTNLVAEYLSICLQNVDRYLHVLAITFTNNATSEMKDRIVRTLQLFSTQSYSTIGGSEKAIFDIVKSMSGLSEDLIQERSASLLEKILFDYQNFSISTIDSFFQRILRSFAYELNLNMNFNVEITIDDYYEQTIDTLYNRISESESALVREVLRLIDETMEKSGKWIVDYQLMSLLKRACADEDSAIPLGELFPLKDEMKVILSKMSDNVKAAQENFLKAKDEGLKILKDSQLDSKCFQGRYNIYKWFENIKDDKLPNYKDVNTIVEDKSSFLKPEYYNASLDIALLKQYNLVNEAFREYKKQMLFNKNMRNLQLLFDLKEIIDEIRTRDNKFFLSDTNYTIYKEIKDVDTPFIYEKVGNRYEYFFIDEFQDTSKMQWENVLPLIKNSLSIGKDSILFGDVKQAIYRFRNGDSRLFCDLTSENPPVISNYGYEPHNLKTNYRSYEWIVKFNNEFFKALPKLNGFPKAKLSEETYYKYYDDVEQEVAECKRGKGFLCVEFAPNSIEKDAFEQYAVSKVWWAVQDALARGYQYKDIAILTRSNALGSLLGKKIALQGVPVISAESLLLSSSDEVNLIVAFLRYIFDCQDDLSKVKIVQCMLRLKSSDKELSELLPQFIADKPKDNASYVKFAASADKNFCKVLLDNFGIVIQRDELSQFPLYSLVNKIISITGIHEQNAFVVSFLDFLLDYVDKFSGEIGAFLEWWDKKKLKLSISAPDNINAIRISTIHKSKGLQYPVVILPVPTKKISKTKQDFWYKTKENESDFPYIWLNYNRDLCELNDEFSAAYEESESMDCFDFINLMYVAHTRPEEAMYLLADQLSESKDDKGNVKAPAADTFAYQMMLNHFIHTDSDSDSGLKDGFVQDADEPLRYWFHGEKQIHSNADIETQSPMDTVERMDLPISDFSIADLSSAHFYESDTTQQEIGNTVHEFLAKLKSFPQTLEEVDQFVFSSGQLYQDEIRNALKILVGDDRYRRYFVGNIKVLNEISILENSEEKVAEGMVQQLIYRPDRVVLFEDETVVIDYKTGSPSDKAKEKYQQQVDKYVGLLGRMNFLNVKGMIIYL